MSSIGTGYDLAASTFSPDGRIFQIEYAQKAVDNAGTVLGLRGGDGAVLAVEKLIPSKLLKDASNARVCSVTGEIGFAAGGLHPDAKALARWCQEEAFDYYTTYREPVPLRYLSAQLSQYVHNYTLSILRPFGCAVLLAGWTETHGAQLRIVDPSGLCYEYHGWAIGKHRQAAKTEIEKLKLSTLPMEQLVREAARIILTVRDEAKDKNFKLELSWVGKSTNGKHRLVPPEIVAEAEKWAQAQIDQEEDSDDDMHA